MSDTQAQEAESLAEWLEGVSEAISARRAAALLRSQAARIAELEKAIERMTNNRDMWKGQCERQAAELARMREPLSDERIAECINKAKTSLFDRDGTTSFRIARAVEAAHGITKPGEQQ